MRQRLAFYILAKWDDAWDSGSDDEAPPAALSLSRQSTASVPAPQPRSTLPSRSTSTSASTHSPINGVGSTLPNGSDPASIAAASTNNPSQPRMTTSTSHSSTLTGPIPILGLSRTFSYTHISPPSPSSYDPNNPTNSNSLPKAEWQVLDTGEIVEAEQSYAPAKGGKGSMYGFGNDWVPEKKKVEGTKSPIFGGLGWGFGSVTGRGSKEKGKEKEKLNGMGMGTNGGDVMAAPVAGNKQKVRQKVGKEALRCDCEEILKGQPKDPLSAICIC